MDTLNPDSGQKTIAEGDRQRRTAREAALIAEADAEIAAGLFVTEAQVDAWIDSIDTEHELPAPVPLRT